MSTKHQASHAPAPNKHHPSHASPPEWGSLPLRAFLYKWLLDPKVDGNYQEQVDRFIALLIVANLFALVFEGVPAIFEPYKAWFHYFDVVSVVIFTVEYAMRFYLAPEDEEFKSKAFPRLNYVRSPFAVIDLLAILPFYLSAFVAVDLRMLRALRLLRIFKILRVLLPAYREFQQLNAGRSFRQKVHALVWPSAYGGQLHEYFDTFIMIWVIISVVAVVLESVHGIHYVLNLEFVILDVVAVGVFTAEYLLRIYSVVESKGHQHSVVGRLKYMKTGNAVIDLLAILPFFLEYFLHHLFDLRFLRVFRLLRLLKLTKYTGATHTLLVVIKREWPVMAGAAFVMLLLVVLTASLGYLFEHEAQPDKFENIPQAIYWAVITLASVGYGDISPVTPIGRAMTIVLALMGIGIFAIPAALLSSAFSDQLRIERENLANELYHMLADGQISAEEQDIIDREAKRLHLGKSEVERLIQRVRTEREQKEGAAQMSLSEVATRPELAVEKYREMLGQIRQLALLSDPHTMNRLIDDPERATALERRIWREIQSPLQGPLQTALQSPMQDIVERPGPAL